MIYPHIDPDMLPMPQTMRLELMHADLEEVDHVIAGIQHIIEVEIEERKKSDEKIQKTTKRWNTVNTIIAVASLFVAIASLLVTVFKAA